MSYPITAIVLAGGLGTRLRPAVPDLPKCLAEVNGKPFIFYILDQLVAAKVDQIVLTVNYRGGQVQAAVGNSYQGVPVDYSWDTIEKGGTGHAARAALQLIAHEAVFILNGDTYVALNQKELIHRSYSKTGFLVNVWNGIVNMGMYLTSFWLIDEVIPVDKPYSLEKSFLHDVWKYGVEAVVINRPFIDIGTPESYAAANDFMSSVV